MKKIAMLLVAFCASSFLSGCATIFGDHNRSITVTSNVPHSAVYVRGEMVGYTPTQVVVDSTWSPGSITVKKHGYDPQTQQVNTSFQPTGFLNFLLLYGAIPAFVIDAATGNMMKLSVKQMNFELEKH